jgi:short-subunit dehydrogenase
MADRKQAWKGKNVLVTGASGGIGAAVARKLAAEGLRVGIAARRADRLEALAAEIRAAGGEAFVFPGDLSQAAERSALVERVRAEMGELDVLVNNAGFAWYGYTAELPWDLAQNMLAVNVEAVVQLTLLFLPAMRERGAGFVINMGSIAGEIPSQGVALYSATKAFLNAFTTALHRELKGSGVHAGVIRPGPVATEFFDTAAVTSTRGRIPSERLAVPPERVAQAVWSMLRRPRRVIYVPGLLALTPWVELLFGWIMDRLGPLLLKRQKRAG